MANSTIEHHAQPPFSVVVKIALARRQWTMGDLARRLGVHRNTVSLAVNREQCLPTRERIERVLEIER